MRPLEEPRCRPQLVGGCAQLRRHVIFDGGVLSETSTQTLVHAKHLVVAVDGDDGIAHPQIEGAAYIGAWRGVPHPFELEVAVGLELRAFP